MATHPTQEGMDRLTPTRPVQVLASMVQVPLTSGTEPVHSALYVEEVTTGAAWCEDPSALQQPEKASGLVGRIPDSYKTAIPAKPALDC